MAYLKNKLLEKQRKYLRRKQRVNTQIKETNPEYRVIITRSLMHVTADVIAADGKVLAQVGGAGNEPGKIIQVNQLEVDAGGRLYVGDIGRSKLSVFTSTGSFLREYYLILLLL